MVVFFAAGIAPVLLLRRLSSIPSLTGMTLVLSPGVTISTTPAGIADAMTMGKVSGVTRLSHLHILFTLDACVSDKKNLYTQGAKGWILRKL